MPAIQWDKRVERLTAEVARLQKRPHLSLNTWAAVEMIAARCKVDCEDVLEFLQWKQLLPTVPLAPSAVAMPPTAAPVSSPIAAPPATTAVDTMVMTGLNPTFLEDATAVVAEGQHIAKTGIPYVVDGLIPAYGMLGMSVAYAKVGKTTFGQQLGAAVAMGRPFLGRQTQQTRVLVIAAEDPPEYTAYLARSLDVDPQRMTFYRHALMLDPPTLGRILSRSRPDSTGWCSSRHGKRS